jgi:hypothetical protein
MLQDTILYPYEFYRIYVFDSNTNTVVTLIFTATQFFIPFNGATS